MNSIELKYGCNPNQGNASVKTRDGGELPFKVLNGTPSYINLLDALNSWQLVSDVKKSLNQVCATSFKHVSPTSASLAIPLSDSELKACQVADIPEINSSKPAMAYARARGADRLSSFGDFIAINTEVDETTASIIKREVSDGVIAPSYTEGALKLLREKKGGKYLVMQMDEGYEPRAIEERDVFGLIMAQEHNSYIPSYKDLENIVTQNKNIPQDKKDDLVLAMIVLKYTQSNSVCFVENGMIVGNGAGQQSRIHCTRLAGDKVDLWHLRLHPYVLDMPFKEKIPRAIKDNFIEFYVRDNEGAVKAAKTMDIFKEEIKPLSYEERQKWLSSFNDVCLASDAFFPFSDNVDRAFASGVKYIAEPGGSVRDEDVIARCDELDIAMAFTKIRLFHH